MRENKEVREWRPEFIRSLFFFFRRFINDFYETHFIFKKGELYGSRRF